MMFQFGMRLLNKGIPERRTQKPREVNRSYANAK